MTWKGTSRCFPEVVFMGVSEGAQVQVQFSLMLKFSSFQFDTEVGQLVEFYYYDG